MPNETVFPRPLLLTLTFPLIRISHDVSPRGTVRVRKPQAGDPKDYVRLHKFFEKILKNHLSPRVYRSANR